MAHNAGMPIHRPSHPIRWIIGGIITLIVLAVGGPFIYIHFFNSAPAALSLPATSPTASASDGGTTTARTSITGTWNTSTGSVVGYRVNEVLLGQNTTAVGRSSSVTGHLTVSGTGATAASFTVPMSTIHSDKSQRDAQFDGRIMDVAPVPASNTVKHYTAHGDLTLHGTTRAVTFTLRAELTGGRIEVSGQIPVLFASYGIPNPSFVGFVTTQNHGILEFLLVFSKA
jgi:polyisoprenoid-binding protein YceI